MSTRRSVDSFWTTPAPPKGWACADGRAQATAVLGHIWAREKHMAGRHGLKIYWDVENAQTYPLDPFHLITFSDDSRLVARRLKNGYRILPIPLTWSNGEYTHLRDWAQNQSWHLGRDLYPWWGDHSNTIYLAQACVAFSHLTTLFGLDKTQRGLLQGALCESDTRVLLPCLSIKTSLAQTAAYQSASDALGAYLHHMFNLRDLVDQVRTSQGITQRPRPLVQIDMSAHETLSWASEHQNVLAPYLDLDHETAPSPERPNHSP